MNLIAPLSHPVAFGPDAEGNLITAEAVAIKWVTLNFTSNEANFECTLPNRPDVAFARTVTMNVQDLSESALKEALATSVQDTVPAFEPQP